MHTAGTSQRQSSASLYVLPRFLNALEKELFKLVPLHVEVRFLSLHIDAPLPLVGQLLLDIAELAVDLLLLLPEPLILLQDHIVLDLQLGYFAAMPDRLVLNPRDV